MRQNFNPKLDEEIVVQAFRSNGQYFAASVTLPAGTRRSSCATQTAARSGAVSVAGSIYPA